MISLRVGANFRFFAATNKCWINFNFTFKNRRFHYLPIFYCSSIVFCSHWSCMRFFRVTKADWCILMLFRGLIQQRWADRVAKSGRILTFYSSAWAWLVSPGLRVFWRRITMLAGDYINLFELIIERICYGLVLSCNELKYFEDLIFMKDD